MNTPIPISDHFALTVTHLGRAGVDDPLTDLQLIEYPAGTFSSWATISLTPFEGSRNVNVQTAAGLQYDVCATASTHPNLFTTPRGTLRAGDSGLAVWDPVTGHLVGVNYAINSQASYHIDVGARSEWILDHIGGGGIPAVPEPGIPFLLLLGAALLALHHRKHHYEHRHIAKTHQRKSRKTSGN